jgi:hypothetical protein
MQAVQKISLDNSAILKIYDAVCVALQVRVVGDLLAGVGRGQRIICNEMHCLCCQIGERVFHAMPTSKLESSR